MPDIKVHITDLEESRLSSSVQSKLNTSGGGNANITIATTTTDITNAGEGATIEFQDVVVLSANFTPPTNQTWIFTTGKLDCDTYTLTGNNTTLWFSGEKLGLDLSSATIAGTFIGDTFYFSNLGGVDDNNSATDNKNTFEEALKLVNSISGTLVVNKTDTGVYWMSSTDLNGEGASPFFPNTVTGLPYIGNGNDGVTMVINGDVEIREISDDIEEKTMFSFYNTTNSKIIVNGTITGDREIHDYVTDYYINTAPTSGTFVRFRILVINPKKDNDIIETIDENISITTGNLATIKSEILSYINTNAAFANYTAAAHPTIADRYEVHGPAGQYFKIFLDEGDTNLTFAEINDANAPHENGWLITWGSRADYCEVLGSGTLQNAIGEALFSNFQGNGQAWIENFTRGDLDFDTGVFTPSGTGDYMIMDDHRSFSTYQHPWFYVGYNAFGAVTSLYPTFWIMWEDASNNFLEMSPVLEMHRRIPILEGASKGRIVLDYTPNSQYMFMDPKSIPLGGKVQGINFVYNRRQHIANPPPDLQIIGSTFDKAGGFSPNFDIDWEDHGKYSTDGLVENCTFMDVAAGSLIFKGNEGTKVVNNIWQAKTASIYSNGAVSTAWGRKALVTGNTFTRRDNSIDISIIFTDNHMTDANLTIAAGGSVVSNNVFIDVTLRDALDSSSPSTSSSGGATTSVVRNQTFLYTKPWSSTGNYTLLREYGSIGYENVIFKFNDRSQLHYSTGVTFPLIYLSNSTIGNNAFARKTITDQYACKGYYKNVKVLDITPTSSGLHNASFEIYAQPIDNFECETNLSIYNGYIVDGIRWKDIKVTRGWLKLVLNQYASTGVGSFPTVYLDRPFVKVPVETTSNNGYLNNTVNGGNEWTTVFRTPLKDVNIFVENGKFESLGDVTGYFLKAEQYGTLTFKDTDFISRAATVDTIDLTDTSRVPATTGVITFIDCNFENITVILRVGDKILYTKSNPNLEVYADNTAALAGGIPVGYMYRTSTGDIKTVY